MEYSSTIRIESKKFAGVAYTLLRMTYWRRAELVELQAAAQKKLAAVQEQMAPLSKAYRAAVDAAKAVVEPQRAELVRNGTAREEAEKIVPLGALDFDDAKFRELVAYADQARAIDIGELTPIACRYVVQGIEGLQVDGVAATIEAVRLKGPDLLYEEIAAAVKHELELTTEERENLWLPSTSAGAVDGEKTRGTANSAGTRDMTMTADAPNSTDPVSADVMAIV